MNPVDKGIDMSGILEALGRTLKGELYTDLSTKIQYATDASEYREMPLAVVRPRDKKDIEKLIGFAREHGVTLIPRTAGTSLAGQVVGKGIVVDVSRHMTKILEVNLKEKWVRVEPGVVLDELNIFLREHGLFFSPETSTSNRCMIGGMTGNNASGNHSLVYGCTRDHLISVKALLSDGSEAEFGPLSTEDFHKKRTGDRLENRIYEKVWELLSDSDNQEEVRNGFPDPAVVRRNTGYALDELLNCEVFSGSEKTFNMCKLLAGSEGTLAFITELKLNLVPLPPPEKALVCIHCHSVTEAIRGNLIALKYGPSAVELMDSVIIQCTEKNISQRKNRFFIQGDPGAILIVEFDGEDRDRILHTSARMEKEMRENGIGYHFPVVMDDDISRVWELRKAGLGVLSNLPGDAKPVSVIEDTAVSPEVLEQYLADFRKILEGYGLDCVYYAHISVGELHLRPILNLKDPEDVKIFRQLAENTARLVRKYRGSMSGEHGDGRLRGEFIPIVIGEQNFELVKQIKRSWDPHNVFNAGKIVDTPPMDKNLRSLPGEKTPEIETLFDFSESHGILRMAEKCNGSGDCRKSAAMGGTMCPSYMATRDENTTTRARANILREFLSDPADADPFDHREIYNVLDLCLSCKGCKSECPSNVDMARMKAEFLQHYYDKHGISLRTRLIAGFTGINAIGSLFPALYNLFARNKSLSAPFKKLIGFTPERYLPEVHRITLRKWLSENAATTGEEQTRHRGELFLFVDEFTNYNDTETGIKAYVLLSKLGYRVHITRHRESGRTCLSKGLLRTAKKIAIDNVKTFLPLISDQVPLVGIEPSALLTFRDEYPDLVGAEMKPQALALSENCMMIDEFLDAEIKQGHITKDFFRECNHNILLHGHCQQKSIASTTPLKNVLSFFGNNEVEEIPSGCCGMAGSFGYEKEHYDLSMKIGELVLFPWVRRARENTIIVASGTSCRPHIQHGTGRKAFHPVDILYDCLS